MGFSDKIFLAYDVRGVYPTELDTSVAFAVGRAVYEFTKAKTIVIARDMRKSSEPLYESLKKSLSRFDIRIIDIGLASTPEFYFTQIRTNSDAGIVVTASHNPKKFDGFKICGKGASPIFIENGLLEIKKLTTKYHQSYLTDSKKIISKARIETISLRDDYKKFISTFLRPITRPLKICVDPGNGMGVIDGKLLKEIYSEAGYDVKFTFINDVLDGGFPNHIPNPVVLENMVDLAKKVVSTKSDFGIAFDGDADRIGFVDNTGSLVKADMITALVAPLATKKGDIVCYGVRTSETVERYLKEHNRKSFVTPAGHAYVKYWMKKKHSSFGGEKSGHYFYKDLNLTDSPLLTAIYIIRQVNRRKDETLKSLVNEVCKDTFILSEINFIVSDKKKALSALKKHFLSHGLKLKEIDGYSFFGQGFWFNIRESNTENLLRLNIEGQADIIVNRVIDELKTLLKKY